MAAASPLRAALPHGPGGSGAFKRQRPLFVVPPAALHAGSASAAPIGCGRPSCCLREAGGAAGGGSER